MKQNCVACFEKIIAIILKQLLVNGIKKIIYTHYMEEILTTIHYLDSIDVKFSINEIISSNSENSDRGLIKYSQVCS